MSHHATACCRRITLGVHLNGEKAVLCVRFGMSLVSMGFRLRCGIVE